MGGSGVTGGDGDQDDDALAAEWAAMAGLGGGNDGPEEPEAALASSWAAALQKDDLGAAEKEGADVRRSPTAGP